MEEQEFEEFEEIQMETTFRFTVEVPMGWRPTDTIDDTWPQSVMGQLPVGPPGGELIDWK